MPIMKKDSTELAHALVHELEAPLVALELTLEKLLAEERCRAAGADCLDRVRELRRLLRSFTQLLATDLARGRFELAPLLERLARRFRPLADAKRIRLEIAPTTLSLMGDAGATERILSNLIDNAIKFSRDGGLVLVRADRGANDVTIEVEDDGIGIPREQLGFIFEPFQRVDRAAPGSGLGLTIARRLAHAQEGSIRAESELGKGASFRLTLPAA